MPKHRRLEMIAILPKPREIITGRFVNDGIVPNNPDLPVVICRDVITFGSTDAEETQIFLGDQVSQNDWCCEWFGSVYRRLHYHSTAHEALIVFKGIADLQIGGKSGREFRVYPGDMILIPAGVGHERVFSAFDFIVFGCYPNGQQWDMQWGWRKNLADSLIRIAKVPIPKSDPLYGKNGPLRKQWK